MDASRLYCGHDRHLLALFIRCMALRGQVGHHSRHQGAQALWVCLRGDGAGAGGDGIGEHVGVCGTEFLAGDQKLLQLDVIEGRIIT